MEAALGKVSQILEALDAEGRKRFLALARKRHVDKGVPVFREGELGDEFFVIAKGRVRVTVQELSGEGEKELAILEHGAFFGEMALLGSHRRSASIVALDDVQLVAFHGPAVNELLRGYPTALQSLKHVGLLRTEDTLEKLQG